MKWGGGKGLGFDKKQVTADLKGDNFSRRIGKQAGL